MITFEDDGFALDTYLIHDNCVNRLLKEWDEYGKLIVAYDFDNTVNDSVGGTTGYSGQVRELVRACKEMGCTMIVFTCRTAEEYPLVKKYLNDNDIPYDYINENIPDLSIKTSNKIFFNILLDDRCGLSASYEILVDVLRKRKAIIDSEGR